MSEKFQCGDNPALAGYLYDECEPDERAAIAAHVAVCAACAAELAALESTRAHLASWAPPEADLGFQIVRGDTVRPETGRILQPAFAPATWWRQPIPGWAQAAAAVLIFAAGISIGVARDGAMSGGAQRTAAAPAAAPRVPSSVEGQAQAAAATAATAVSAQDLAALEQRLRAEIVQARAAAEPASPRVVNTSGVSPADLDTLEQRLQSEMALRMTQMAREFEMQRRVDLARIGQEIGPFNAEIIRQRQDLNNVNNLIRTSLQGR